MHSDFPNNLTRKIHAEQCLTLYSRWRTQQTHVCFHVQFQYHVCYRNKPFHSNTLLVLLLCNVSYCVSYRDICIGIRIVSWKNVSLRDYTWYICIALNSNQFCIITQLQYIVKLQYKLDATITRFILFCMIHAWFEYPHIRVVLFNIPKFV